MNLTDYKKLEHQRDPSQPLTACQQWKLTDLSYLKTFYKQGHRSARGATSRTSTEHSSDEEADDRGHESSSSSRRETPTKIPVLNLPTPARRPKKRRDDRTDSDKDETSSKLNEIVGVMKDSANHLVARSQTVAHDPRKQERVSFFQWMLEFTSRMPRQNWREFQKQAFTLACAYTPTLSPRPPLETTNITGVFYLFIASWSRSTIPNEPPRKTSGSRCWWIRGAAVITVYWNGEQLSFGPFVNALLVVNRFCTTKCNVCKLSVKII